MQIFKKIVPLCLLLASGCGGGGSDFDALSGTQAQNPDGHETQLPRGFRVIETLFDGQSAVRFFVPAEPSVYTGIVEDQTVAEVLYNGTLRSIKDVRSKKNRRSIVPVVRSSDHGRIEMAGKRIR